MIPAPIPPDDAERVRALRELLLLDTPPEERFDRVVQFAAEQFECPIAAVSLVDADRQWFKARVGLDASETARDISFCGHAITRQETMVVEDALRDPRFADNPLVLGEPRIRFYAGTPLTAPGGQLVGTLCLIDRRPRSPDTVDIAVLRALAKLVQEELTGDGG
jgi:GAF domain-containing protein